MSVTVHGRVDKARPDETILDPGKRRIDHPRLRVLADGVGQLVEPKRSFRLREAGDHEHVPAVRKQGVNVPESLEVYVITPRDNPRGHPKVEFSRLVGERVEFSRQPRPLQPSVSVVSSK